jgi:hypothetical protein
MPKQKDLKRQIRGRMRKTGESYTAARSQLLRKAIQAEKKSPLSPAEYARLAGMSDDAVRTKTGRTWEHWVRALDQGGAARMTHREITEYLHEHYKVPAWWTQMVTVGYERIRGLRAIGQRRDGLYEASKSKTIAAPIGKLYRAFIHKPTRQRWLPADVKIRTSIRDKSVRITWEDDTSVEAYFIKRGAGKSQVAIQHRKLPDQAAIARSKSYWAERLAALTELLTAS